jgi:uncharacterized protein
MRVEKLSSLASVSPTAWDALTKADYPFSAYSFLRALEQSGSVGESSGWKPVYFVAYEREDLIGAIFAYEKSHSYGEYIFDWAWASAYERVGIPYYPKLVAAVPMTPATGPRILVADGSESEKVQSLLIDAVLEHAAKAPMSSVHFLFCSAPESALLEKKGFLVRHTYQFHWRNRSYVSFDDFLSHLKSRKRKQIQAERASVGGFTFRTLTGKELTDNEASAMDSFYRSTTERKQGIDYLRPGFFHSLFQTGRDQIVLFSAFRGEAMVAGSLCFFKGAHLYGRHWGAAEEIPGMHFELCYYRPVEFAIAQGVQLFEAGAQGDHKIARGFLPEVTYSAHWIRHPEFKLEIGKFLEREKAGLKAGLAAFTPHSPYRAS